jgi:hypothetical protein
LLINVGDFVEVPYSSIVLLRGCLVLWTKV